ncbi:hypothetical protein CDAR_491911 [Caerostris darwini]|uniref:Uncharacterized protein n=1 Tax=Caerostris darwini TaxID=1538125 RepID=A0AAV4N0F3_9ARAC|nr:hypothetical protein CDAR_491911 [Caerostris darwini]
MESTRCVNSIEDTPHPVMVTSPPRRKEKRKAAKATHKKQTFTLNSPFFDVTLRWSRGAPPTQSANRTRGLPFSLFFNGQQVF